MAKRAPKTEETKPTPEMQALERARQTYELALKLIEIGRDSPCKFNVGDEVQDDEGDLFIIVKPFGVHECDSGSRPGYLIRHARGEMVYFSRAGRLFDHYGDIKHLQLVSG